jgi:hypothetical protein
MIPVENSLLCGYVAFVYTILSSWRSESLCCAAMMD